MNTPDKCEYCSAREQEHGYGVICEHNTPDTEGEKHVAYSPEINQIRPILVKYFNEYPADLLADLSSILSSRDTYWKERVQKEVEGMRKEIDVPRGEYGHYEVEGKIEDVLDTLLENLIGKE